MAASETFLWIATYNDFSHAKASGETDMKKVFLGDYAVRGLTEDIYFTIKALKIERQGDPEFEATIGPYSFEISRLLEPVRLVHLKKVVGEVEDLFKEFYIKKNDEDTEMFVKMLAQFQEEMQLFEQKSIVENPDYAREVLQSSAAFEPKRELVGPTKSNAFGMIEIAESAKIGRAEIFSQDLTEELNLFSDIRFGISKFLDKYTREHGKNIAIYDNSTTVSATELEYTLLVVSKTTENTLGFEINLKKNNGIRQAKVTNVVGNETFLKLFQKQVLDTVKDYCKETGVYLNTDDMYI